MTRFLTALVLGLSALATPAFASDAESLTGKVEVTRIFCFVAPCPAPLVRLRVEGQPAVRLTGKFEHWLGFKNGETITVTGLRSADGRELDVASYSSLTETAPAEVGGANVSRDAKTRPVGFPIQTGGAQTSEAQGAGLKRD